MKKQPLLKKTLRIPVDIWDVILELSEEHNTTPSVILRIILKKYIYDYKKVQYEEED